MEPTRASKKRAKRQKFVDHEPRLAKIDEASRASRPQDKVDYLIRLGLGGPDRIIYYRKVITDPTSAMRDPILRPYVAKVADLLLDVLFSDLQTWNRTRQLLQQRHPTQILSRVSEGAYRSLERRARRGGVSVDVVLEVYRRGLREGLESRAFARVDSFVAGGAARELDADLLEKSGAGEQGTPELSATYAEQTPGQDTLAEKIKKALRREK